MKATKTRAILGVLIIAGLAAVGGGCELMTSVDRDKIPSGGPVVDASMDVSVDGPSEADVSAGQDARPDGVEAGLDAMDASDAAEAPADVVPDVPADAVEADAAPTCKDGVQNGNETDVDCGGADCLAEGKKCGDNEKCKDTSDCSSGVCALAADGGTEMRCQAATCNDKVKNGNETATDCGGGTCPPCPDNATCAVDSDCTSDVCLAATDAGTAKVCQAPACDDQRKNDGETDVDCGGNTSCPRCLEGKICVLGLDCASKVCADVDGGGNKCAVPSCTDSQQNGNETDVDCGGNPSCPRCKSGQMCTDVSDCDNNLLCALPTSGGSQKYCQLPHCQNNVKDPSLGETDVDCGGPDCSKCVLGKECLANTDCQGGACKVVSDAGPGSCVECLVNEDCVAGKICNVGTNACVAGCTVSHACQLGQDCCSGQCKDLATDAQNCGTCGNACNLNNATSACVSKNCAIVSCNTNFADCNTVVTDGCEVNTQSDPDNCSACSVGGSHVCLQRANSSRACAAAVCGFNCNANWGNCDSDPTTGCETDLRITVNHCNSCTHDCTASPPAHTQSPSCSSGVCNYQCVNGWLDCTGGMTDGCETDGTGTANCGACGNSCSTNPPQHTQNPVCSSGTCTYTCVAGWGDCNGNILADGCETNTQTTTANCGVCAHDCAAAPPAHTQNPTCSAGMCGYTCVAGWNDCNANILGDGCEINTQTSTTHCGTCTTDCTAAPPAHTQNPGCAAGACTYTCAAGWGDCDANMLGDGCETNTQTTTGHCGTCGTDCAASPPANTQNPGCNAGSCTYVCIAGWGDCNANMLGDGCETNTQTATGHCGTCGTDCAASPPAHTQNPTCGAGVCGYTCVAGWNDCNANMLGDGCEVNTQTSATHCGTCTTDCTASPPAHTQNPGCASGVCTYACAAGWGDCDGNMLGNGCETNTQTTTGHCGICATDCAVSAPAHTQNPTCSAGVCGYACAAGWGDCDGNMLGTGCETNTQTTTGHCGICATDCTVSAPAHTQNPGCAAGACTYGCVAGWGDCDANMLGTGCETNTLITTANCGTCAHDCGTSPPAHTQNPGCAAGACTYTCTAGWGDCDANMLGTGCETNTLITTADCGSCSHDCVSLAPQHTQNPGCSAGVCTYTCAPDWGDCNSNMADGCETDTRITTVNCGACGNDCATIAPPNTTSPSCVTSVCQYVCQLGWDDCDGNMLGNGCETHLGTDTNCAACGNDCTVSGKTCQGGTCL